MAGGQDFTANLSLPYLISNQAQKHVTLNESLRALDGLVWLSGCVDVSIPSADHCTRTSLLRWWIWVD